MAQTGAYTTIKAYRSETASLLPEAANMAEGELAINITDQKLYTKNAAGDIVQIGSSPSDVQAAVNAMLRPSVVTDSTQARTISAEDENTILLFTNASAITVTVPDGNALPDGFICHLHQQSTGAVSVVGTGAVTVDSVLSLASGAQFAALSLIKTGNDAWVLVGDQA